MTSEPDRAPAQRSLLRFHNVAKIVFYLTLLILFFHFLLRLHPFFDPSQGAEPNIVDFTIYWAAAKLFVAGDPALAFDRDIMIATAGFTREPHAGYAWLYPPLAIVALSPLGFLSYPAAVLSFAIVSMLALWAAMRKPAAAVPGLVLMGVTAPVVVIGSLMIGQISALLAACLVSALWFIRQDRYALAGLMFALMTVKPHLGIFIPIALAAGRYWRVIMWAGIFTLVLNVGATLMTGISYWSAFLDAVRNIFEMSQNNSGFKVNFAVTPYGFFRAIGTEHDFAISGQIAIAILAALALVWMWSRPHVSMDLKCAALCAALPLATSHGSYVEATTTIAAAVFLVRDGFGQALGARAWLFLIWLGPLPAFLAPGALSPAILVPPIIIVTLLICLGRAKGEVKVNSAL